MGEPGVKLISERHHDHRRSLWCDDPEVMLIYSMSVSVDGFITDRAGAFAWPPVTEDVPLHLMETRTFGSSVIYERYGRAPEKSD